MRLLLTLVNRLFEILLLPFRTLAPVYALTFLSVLTGLIMLLAFRFLSNQQEIKKAREQLKAHLLALWLFQDQLRVVFRTHARLLRCLGRYLRHALRPLAVMFVPLLFILVQADMRFGQLPAAAGQPLLVTAHLADASLLPQTALRLPAGVGLQAPPLRLPDDKEITWKVAAQQPGEYNLEVAVGERSFAKSLRVGGGLAALSTRRVRASWVEEFAHPGEPPLPADAPLEWIEVRYPPQEISLASVHMHWLVAFLIISLASAFALKGLVGAEI